MKVSQPSWHGLSSLAIERLLLMILVAVYVVIFNVTVAHGDALRISSQIESGFIIPNPNHLLFDLFGFAWYALLTSVGLSIDVLTGFEIISGISTLASILLFHVILVDAGVRSSTGRLILVAGLFASKNFLSLTVSQYFFMLQMPFLLGALWYAIKLAKARDQAATAQSKSSIYGMSACLAIAACIEINNVIPIIFLGFVIALRDPKTQSWNIPDTIRFWSVAALIGFPVYWAAYFFSDATVGFLPWVLSYAGDSGSSVDSFYGTKLSLQNLVSSAATVIFHFLFGNVVETAGLGTVLKSLFLDQPLEFIPSKTRIALAILLMPVVGAGILLICFWAIRKARTSFASRLLVFWILAYLCFNFYWPYSGDLFWFQMLPLMWLLLGMSMIDAVENVTLLNRRIKLLTPVAGILVLGLLALNTFQTVMPMADSNLSLYRQDHRALLREGDLEIITGWDSYKWMMQDESGPSTDRLLLMNMTFVNEKDPGHISQLPTIVEQHLESGGRVVIARLYKLDRESNPWYGLAANGWPRSRIQELLSGYCTQPLGIIDGVGFHQISECVDEETG